MANEIRVYVLDEATTFGPYGSEGVYLANSCNRLIDERGIVSQVGRIRSEEENSNHSFFPKGAWVVLEVPEYIRVLDTLVENVSGGACVVGAKVLKSKQVSPEELAVIKASFDLTDKNYRNQRHLIVNEAQRQIAEIKKSRDERLHALKAPSIADLLGD